MRGRASVGGGWAAMLNAETQEGGAVNRWWVKDKPEVEQEKPPAQDSATAVQKQAEAGNSPGRSEDVAQVNQGLRALLHGLFAI